VRHYSAILSCAAHLPVTHQSAPFVGGISPGYSPSYHSNSMPTVPTRTFSPPLGPPPGFPQPSVSISPPSHFPVPSHSSSLYNPTYQTAPWNPNRNYPTPGPSSCMPHLGSPSVRDRANSNATIAKVVPNLQLLCVPFVSVKWPCFTFLLLAAALC
jgi:hypothetical protein